MSEYSDNSISFITEDELDESSSFDLTHVSQDGAVTPTSRPQPKIYNAAGQPTRILKRTRLDFEGEIVKTRKPLKMISPSTVKSTNTILPDNSSSKLEKPKVTTSRVVRTMKRTFEKGKKNSNTSLPNSCISPISSASSISLKSNDEQYFGVEHEVSKRIGLRLRNLLKLRKASKWVLYEWFYSYLDKPLFERENDFQIRLAKTFPRLRTRNLTIVEWQKVRATIGKPRRFSDAFLNEERMKLNRMRQKIRFLQICKLSDIKDSDVFEDLPDKIPLTLPLGTKVTARLRTPVEGIFVGKVMAFNYIASTYSIKFDRAELGIHIIPDYEIVSENYFEMLSLQGILENFCPNFSSEATTNADAGNKAAALNNDENTLTELERQLYRSNPLFSIDVKERECINGHPVKMLETMVRLKLKLSLKRIKIEKVRTMNNKAALLKSQYLSTIETNAPFDEIQNAPDSSFFLSDDFQRQYATIVLSMDKLNRDILVDLKLLQSYDNDLAAEVQVNLDPTQLHEKYCENAQDIVQRNNPGTIQNKRLVALLEKLSTVLVIESQIHIEGMEKLDQLVQAGVEQVTSSISKDNADIFEVHVLNSLEVLRTESGHPRLTNN